MSDGLGGMGGGPSDELLGIMYDDGQFKDYKNHKEDNGPTDRERMLAYGKTAKKERKKNFFSKLFRK